MTMTNEATDHIMPYNSLNSQYDQSILNSIDPDVHYYNDANNNCTKYYHDSSFRAQFEHSQYLSCFHLNIRSLPENYVKLMAYMDNLSVSMKILALSETWIKPHHINYKIPHYNIEQDYRSRKRGGGVCMYIHESLQYKIRDDLKIGDDPECINSIFIEIDRTSINSKRNIVVACVYRPPWVDLTMFNEALTQTLDVLVTEDKHTFILGDLNIDISHDATTNLSIEGVKNTFSSYHYYPLINSPTRVTDHSSTIIDNIYCNVPQPCNMCDVGILRPDISDHHAIFCMIKYTMSKRDKSILTKRHFTKKNIAIFRAYLREITWNCVLYANSTQESFTCFQGVIDLYFEKSFPKQTFTMNYETRLSWMTDILRKDISLKNKLHVISINCPADKIMKSVARIKRNHTNSLLKNAEIEYYSNQLEMNKCDIVKTWKTMKTIIGKNCDNTKKKLNFVINNEIISDNDIVASEFNHFFVSIGPELASCISCTVNPLSYVNYVQNSIVIQFVSQFEIRSIISKLKNSSPGWDEIPAQYAKLCIDYYIEPLTHVINMSLIEGIFPSELKLAKVVPVFKGGDSSNISNYRPISVLSFFSKIFEKVMYNYVLNFMEKNKVLYKHQFGFRQNHSCQQAIITLIEKITSCLDTGDLVIGVFIDLKKAFDTVNHKILLKKLHAYGIRGSFYRWFESYLSDRSQYVTYNGCKSKTECIACGVPQGSILGPLLFIIYMNDICNVSNLLFTILYADDTCVLLNGKDLIELYNALNVELALLVTWLKSNKLSLNVKKSYYIIFHRARLKLTDSNCLICMDQCNLNRTLTLKYLGIILDSKITWIPHITYVKNKISKGIGIIYKARNYLDRKSLINLYHSYVYPYLTYCIEAWGNASNCHLDQLYLIQKRIIRIITYSDYNISSDTLFRRLDILPLHKLVYNRIGMMMYKFANNLLPDVMNDLYITNNSIHSHYTRQCNMLHINKGNLNVYTHSFKFTSAHIWNFLQSKFNVNVSIAKFKKVFKAFLHDNNIHRLYTILRREAEEVYTILRREGEEVYTILRRDGEEV